MLWEEDIRIRSRLYFSIQHIQSAAFFARNVAQIEQAYSGASVNEILTPYWANVTASVFMAVSFLEATINESFSDAAEEYEGNLANLDEGIREKMASIWKQDVSRTSIMDKFNLALAKACKPAFTKGEPPAQNVKILINLRNDLVHYKPEWIPDGEEFSKTDTKKNELGKQLRGKFAPSPIMGKNTPFYPDSCLGYGCAKWAVESSIAYADEFYSRMGISAPYEHVRASLSTT